MIFGIGGKIGSGKDTVARIILYLIHVDMVEKGQKAFLPSLSSYLDNTLLGVNTVGWEIKKFAGKLKKIASILTGVPEYLFEDQKFKETYLSSEWNLNGGADKFQIRLLLQRLGTDAIRDIIHPNAWVNALFADYRPDYGDPRVEAVQGFGADATYPNWIISDLRFPNEFEAIQKRQGVTILVRRPDPVNISDHISETALDDYTFDYVIINSGTLEELVEKVRVILVSEGIIN